jgi:hypothetical protein
MSRALSSLAVVALAGAALAATASAPGAPSQEVTLRLERFYDNACRCYKFRFFGTIPSGAANEYVSVLQQRCGQKFSTAVAGASTREGGAWEVIPSSVGHLGGSATFRARWKSQVSQPVTYRAELMVWLTKLGAGRYRAGVYTDQNFKGRIVELQRLVAGQWKLVRRARFVRDRSSFTAKFKAPRTGTFRAFVPARSASPCYGACASKPLASTPPSSGSGHVVDRTLVCSIAMQGGLRQFTIHAYPGGQQSASVEVTSNWVPDWNLVGAGTTMMRLNPERCTEAQAQVPLSATNLRGGSPGPAGQVFDCQSPERVLVRIRAVFASATTLEQDRPFGYLQLVARGEVTQAAVAVRTQRGKQLAYATISSSGAARLYRAGGCIEDDN